MFPVTQSTFLEDRHTRLTLLVNHATSAATVSEGSLEVMLDRRTVYDDARGMGEGVLDSRPTTQKFWLLLEPRDPQTMVLDSILPSLSPLATLLSRQLDHPPSLLHSTGPTQQVFNDQRVFLDTPLPCDYHLLNLRSWNLLSTSPAHALLTLQRAAPDCSWASISLPGCLRPAPAPHLSFTSFPALFKSTSLTGSYELEEEKEGEKSQLFSLNPMGLSSYNVTFT